MPVDDDDTRARLPWRSTVLPPPPPLPMQRAESARVQALQAQCAQLQHALDQAYAERNQVVVALASVCSLLGLQVGRASDPHEPDWPVLFLDLPIWPCGEEPAATPLELAQVSWHLHPSERALVQYWPPYPRSWDGHDTPTKYARLARWARSCRR